MSQSPPDTRRLPSRSELAPWLARALDRARKGGASAADASISESRALTVSVRAGEVESVEFQRDRDLSVTVYVGQRSGHASTSDLSESGLAQTVEAALAIAAASGEDPCAGLADAACMAREFPDLDLFHPWELLPEQAIAQALACEAAALASDPRIKQSEGASLDTRSGVSLYANTHGFVGERRASDHSLSCAVIAADEAGMQRDYWYDSARDAASLAAADAIGRRAGERAVARLGARQLRTGRVPVLFVPEIARSLFGHFLGAISGGALYRKSSFLLDQIDQPVFAAGLRLEQQPFIPRGAGSRAFDQEGVATRNRVLVDESGVLRGYLLSSYSARKLGMQTTGNAGGVFNLVVQPGSLDFPSLLREMGSGLVVTELMGQGVNLITGDYSRGAAGYWVENGAIAYPVEEVTVAGNLAAMFRGIAAVGKDVDTRGGVRTGSVLIEQMMVAGN